MNRILITGASGFIGQHVVDAAVARGYEVVALVRDRGAYRGASDHVMVVEGDVRDPAGVRAAMEGCDGVVHAAAVYSFDPGKAEEMRSVNVGGTRNVLQSALAAGVERVVYTGTVGGTAFSRSALATETNVAGPESMSGPYKRSKFEAERVARDFGAQGAPIVIVCPTAPIGPGDRKPTPTGRIVRDYMRRRMPAFVDTGLNFVHVKDVADGHVLALERGTLGARYLLGNTEGNLTLIQAFRILAELTEVAAPRFRLPYAAALLAAGASELYGRALSRPPAIPLEAVRMSRSPMWVDPTWSVRTLGLPQTPVRQAFQDAVEWFACRAGDWSLR